MRNEVKLNNFMEMDENRQKMHKKDFEMNFKVTIGSW